MPGFKLPFNLNYAYPVNSSAIQDLLRQRVFGLACGYEDGNDAARVAHDPMHKLVLCRDPLTGAPLASQPTLSRFENAVGPWPL